ALPILAGAEHGGPAIVEVPGAFGEARVALHIRAEEDVHHEPRYAQVDRLRRIGVFIEIVESDEPVEPAIVARAEQIELLAELFLLVAPDCIRNVRALAVLVAAHGGLEPTAGSDGTQRRGAEALLRPRRSTPRLVVVGSIAGGAGDAQRVVVVFRPDAFAFDHGERNVRQARDWR